MLKTPTLSASLLFSLMLTVMSRGILVTLWLYMERACRATTVS